MPLRNLLIILVVALQATLTWQRLPVAAQDEETYEFYRLLVDVLDRVERNYVHEVDRKKLLRGAVEGMLRTLDPYSEFIAADELPEFKEQTEGHFGGVGISVEYDPRTGHLVVISPLPDTPAFHAGIVAGDRIVAVDGEPIKNLSMEEAINRIKGPVGTKVTLSVLHPGADEPVDITVTRQDIKVESVKGWERRPDGGWNWIVDPKYGIAYIRITQFTESTAEDLKKAVQEARQQGMKALVLDLRFNPGGLLEAAVEVADIFLKAGQTIVSVKGRNVRSAEWKASGKGIAQDLPIVVMVNHFSASAAEIVSAALQDNKRAIVVGRRTWGKGSVQNIIPLADGRSALKLTTAEYYRPSGKNIHRRPGMTEQDEWGVVPDVELPDMTPAQTRAFFAWLRDKDIIPNAKKPEQSRKKAKFDDFQLQKAIEILRERLQKGAKPGTKEGAERAADLAHPAPSLVIHRHDGERFVLAG